MTVNHNLTGAFARTLAATALVGLTVLGATPAAARALTSMQLVEAKTLAEMIVDATERANLTPDNPATVKDETRAAIERAVEATIETFHGGRSAPGVVAEALFLAKARLVAGGDWCPANPSATKPSMKSRAAPEMAHSCAMAAAYNTVGTIVQTADNALPASNGGNRNNNNVLGPPSLGSTGGAGGSVIYAGVK
jgi:hypothetical protein